MNLFFFLYLLSNDIRSNERLHAYHYNMVPDINIVIFVHIVVSHVHNGFTTDLKYVCV